MFLEARDFSVVQLNRASGVSLFDATPLSQHSFAIPEGVTPLDNTDPLTCLATDMAGDSSSSSSAGDFVWWISSNFIYEQSSSFDWLNSGDSPPSLTYGFFIAERDTTMVAELPVSGEGGRARGREHENEAGLVGRTSVFTPTGHRPPRRGSGASTHWRASASVCGQMQLLMR